MREGEIFLPSSVHCYLTDISHERFRASNRFNGRVPKSQQKVRSRKLELAPKLTSFNSTGSIAIVVQLLWRINLSHTLLRNRLPSKHRRNDSGPSNILDKLKLYHRNPSTIHSRRPPSHHYSTERRVSELRGKGGSSRRTKGSYRKSWFWREGRRSREFPLNRRVEAQGSTH